MSEELTFKQFESDRLDMQRDIVDIINKFSDKYKVTVKDLCLTHSCFLGKKHSNVIVTKAEIEL